MKKSDLIIISFTLMLFSLANFINRYYFFSIVSIILSVLILTVIIIIAKGKLSIDLLDLSVITIQLLLTGLFFNQLKEISTVYIFISMIIALFNLLYHKAVATLNIKKQKYCYIISIVILSCVFCLTVLLDLIVIILFSLEKASVFNYLTFLFIISFPTLFLGFPYIFFQKTAKA